MLIGIVEAVKQTQETTDSGKVQQSFERKRNIYFLEQKKLRNRRKNLNWKRNIEIK